jgi:asparagine synthase (glutamine-hydrolysing)
MKIADGKGKQVLRSLLDRHIPRDLIERPKQGFAIPLDRWLRGELRSWAEALLSDDELFDLAGLEPAAVRIRWARHQNSSINNGTQLWTILMFFFGLADILSSPSYWLVVHRQSACRVLGEHA